MNCNEVYLHICDNLDENISSPRCRAIKKHLEHCPDCQSYLYSLKATIALYRAMPVPHLPSQAHRELFKTLSILTDGPGTRKRQPRPAVRKRGRQ